MTRIFNTETKLPYIILFLVTVFSIYPFFYMISTSFMTVGEATNQYLFPKKLIFENYKDLKGNEDLPLETLLISFKQAIISVKFNV